MTGSLVTETPLTAPVIRMGAAPRTDPVPCPRAPSLEAIRMHETIPQGIQHALASLQHPEAEWCHVEGGGLACLLAAIHAHDPRPLLVLTPEPEDADDLVADLALFAPHDPAFVLPAWDILPSETEALDLLVAQGRVQALRALHDAQPRTVVAAPAIALLQPVLPPDALAKRHLHVQAGMELPPDTLMARLVDAGFERVSLLDDRGQCSRRGGILDVFPLFGDAPVRIEWFGDEIDTVRHFDLQTQRSGAPLATAVPLLDIPRGMFRQAYDAPHRHTLAEHLPPDACILFLHPERIRHVLDLYAAGFPAARSPLVPCAAALAALDPRPVCMIPHAGSGTWIDEAWRPGCSPVPVDAGFLGVERFSGSLDTALTEIDAALDQGHRVEVFCHNDAEAHRFRELLLENAPSRTADIAIRIGHLSHGFLHRDAKRIVLCDHGIFGRFQLRRPPKHAGRATPLADFTDLRPGDHVVHLLHGIARFEDIETLESDGTKQDYLKLTFADEAALYVPLSHIDLVQRYIGGKDARPPLSKLGGKSWARRKRAAEAAVHDIAADLLRLQAVRKTMPGTAYPPDDDLVREFDAAFPYEETPDQQTAIAAIKRDQQDACPMDRLLCGDVGFGKTEVAMRAAFKTVCAGKQVAVLVPTTILAEQHLRSFTERMADYPVRVGCLSRFRSTAETRELLDGIRKGQVDIVIGTHRLLGKDVVFRDLGLVVIDEEQRFGVEQKEVLKAFRASVDVLTMTATPIPRTLNMALLGLRDISNLTTAPADRQAVRTEVIRHSEELIRRAILRELARGGQVFFLHNRVQTIHKIAADLARLVPEARFGIAHGQLPEGELLDVMNRFLDHDMDVLVCTTIIESGVDIPTVNTLFVNQADHFGLSGLHQLRGRVGRYKNKAYAYFLIPKNRPITPIARKRLTALEEYAELGAGFRLAMRDLEIRGAGNILGMEQSGHIHLVGFDLYCRLLEKAVAELRGDTVEETLSVELNLGTAAFLPTDYIETESRRIDVYRKLHAAPDAATLEALAAWMRDCFGAPPPAVVQLLEDQAIRIRAADVGVSALTRMEGALAVGFADGLGRQTVQKLRTLARKVTPLGKGRWRVAMAGGEEPRTVALEVLSSLRSGSKDA